MSSQAGGPRLGRRWAVGVTLAGAFLVGATFGGVWSAVPDRQVSRDWVLTVALMSGPYLLSAAGCWLSPAWVVRGVAGLVVLTGLVMAGAVAWELWPTYRGAPPPAISVALLLDCLLLIGQYGFGLAGFVGGLAKRRAGDTGSLTTE